jgi:hypothetical protein
VEEQPCNSRNPAQIRSVKILNIVRCNSSWLEETL